MGANSFGRFFTITSWGESHGPAMGVVIDGCPAGLKISQEQIQKDLDDRRPGKRAGTSPRQELDQVEILSGLYEGKTTGSPISLLIRNEDVREREYDLAKKVYRPGHANYTYHQKYGHEDSRGGGRSSGRETLCRVAAGSIAHSLLQEFGIEVHACLLSLGANLALQSSWNEEWKWQVLRQTPLFTCDERASEAFFAHLTELSEKGESCGGEIRVWARGLFPGLGDPVYAKISNAMASAFMSIPAVKSVSLGDLAACMSDLGSDYRDELSVREACKQNSIRFCSNKAGGLLGGISTGETIYATLAVKPTSSTQKEAASVDREGKRAIWKLKKDARHDPCIAIRAVPVARAMLSLVLADALLANMHCKLDSLKSIYHNQKEAPF